MSQSASDMLIERLLTKLLTYLFIYNFNYLPGNQLTIFIQFKQQTQIRAKAWYGKRCSAVPLSNGNGIGLLQLPCTPY